LSIDIQTNYDRTSRKDFYSLSFSNSWSKKIVLTLSFVDRIESVPTKNDKEKQKKKKVVALCCANATILVIATSINKSI